jgi:hypothetical protein
VNGRSPSWIISFETSNYKQIALCMSVDDDSRERTALRNLFWGKVIIVFLAMMVIYSVSKGFSYQTSNYNTNPPNDYFLLWDVPKVLSIKPVSNIYSDEGLSQIRTELIHISNGQEVSAKQQLVTAKVIDHESLRPVGSPLLFTCIGLLATGEFDRDLYHYCVIILICYMISIGIFCILLRMPAALTLFCIFYFTSCYDPYLSDIFVVNINQIQLLIVASILYVFSKNMHVICGLLLGFALMLKPNTLDVYVLMCAGYIIRYNYKQLLRMNIGLITGIAASFIVSSIYFDNYYIWMHFLKSITSTLRFKLLLFEDGNYGLVSLVHYLTGYDVVLLAKAALLSPVAYMIYLSRKRKDIIPVCDDNNGMPASSSGIRQGGAGLAENVNYAFLLVGAGCLVMLLSSELVWLHYYVLQIPVMLYLLKAISRNRLRLYAKIAAVCIVAGGNSFFMKYLGSHVISSVLLNICTLLMLIALFKIMMDTLNRKACFA